MLFNSFNFLIFFPVVTALYFLLPHRFRWIMLLAASCVFYMFFIPVYILILIFTIIIDYCAGILIEKQEDQTKRKRWLVMSLVANVGVLAVFKYYNFFINNIDDAVRFLGWNYSLPVLKMLLPIGLSFHTFQAMSYTIEVYRGNQKAEKHFGIYALYVMYYPQLVAGPIERPQNLLPQFHAKHDFDYVRVTNGLKRMAWGLFKKVAIADRISVLVASVYDQPNSYHGTAVVLATFLFAIQIYCDFSGYSDMALGASEVMGIKLMTNFRQPYFARTISEFWKRWHISLSTWFRDYVYIPLGGNRKGKWKTYRNLFLTFVISGFWHGANWTFLIWGALHGTFLVFANLTEVPRNKFRQFIRIDKHEFLSKTIDRLQVFLLVSFAWIFFRAKDLSIAWKIIKDCAIGILNYFHHLLSLDRKIIFEPVRSLMQGKPMAEFLVILILIVVLFAFDSVDSRRKMGEWFTAKPSVIRWSAYFGLCLLILLFGVYHDKNEFIYFQF